MNNIIHYLELGYHDNAQKIINDGFDINTKNDNYYNLLMLLVKGNINCSDPISTVYFLINNKIDLNATDFHGNTVLMMVPFKHNNILEIILSAGADPNIKNCFGSTAIMTICLYPWIAHYTEIINIIQKFITFGADINLTDKLDRTALMLLLTRTASNDIDKIVAYMVKISGINLNITDDENMSALMYASQIQDNMFFVYLKILLDAGARDHNGEAYNSVQNHYSYKTDYKIRQIVDNMFGFPTQHVNNNNNNNNNKYHELYNEIYNDINPYINWVKDISKGIYSKYNWLIHKKKNNDNNDLSEYL